MPDRKIVPDDHGGGIDFFLGRLKAYRISPKGVLHVGAHQGEEVEAYRRFGFQRIVLVEANPKWCALLGEKFKHDKTVEIYNYAVNDSDGVVPLNIHRSRSGNTEPSSLLPLKRFKELYKYIQTVESIEVPAITLDHFFGKNGLDPSDYSFLNIDIQGAELRAFRGGLQTLSRLEAVLSEVNLTEMYEGCALEGEIIDFLDEKGFKDMEGLYHELYNEKERLPAWGEVLFVKKRLLPSL